MPVKAKEAALAVIIGGLGIGIAILVDNSISQHKYVKAKAILRYIEEKEVNNPHPVAHRKTEEREYSDSEEEEENGFSDEEEEETSDIDAAASYISDPLLDPVVPSLPKVEPEGKVTIVGTHANDEERSIGSNTSRTSFQRRLQRQESKKGVDTEINTSLVVTPEPMKPLLDKELIALAKADKRRRIAQREEAKLKEKIRVIEEKEKEDKMNTTELLPGETYIQYFTRQKRIKEDKEIEEADNDAYRGNFNAASKNLYLMKRAYVDARKKMSIPKD